MNRTPIVCTSILSLALLSAAAILAAGPLNPPAGPVASTYKTLSEIEPRIAINAANTPGDAACVVRLSQAGSYYLTANITGVSAKSGILISASGVTIDLNGFALQGVPGSFTGIAIAGGSFSNITIRNGTISSWGGSGIDLAGGVVDNSLIESVQARSNASHGIRSSNAGVVRNCTASHNASYGIIGFDSSIVESSIAYSNAVVGIGVGPGSIVRDCVSRANLVDGIDCGSQSIVTACTALANGFIGIKALDYSTVQLCTTQSNGTDGIQSNVGCTITSNTCSANGTSAGGGAGIHALGAANRIEANVCISTDRGVSVDSVGNFIVRNTCRANTTDWVIAGNNAFGPIIDRRVTGSAAVSGSAAPSSLVSTDPNANFSY